MAGRTIGIKVRTDDFSTYTRVRSIERVTNEVEAIAAVALQLLRDNAPERPVRLVGVRVAGFGGAFPPGPKLTRANVPLLRQ